MSTLKLHYEGWLALPAGFRQKLGLKSGDRLEAELAGGTITLRPAGRPAPPATRRAARQPAPATLPPVSKSRGRRKAKETGGRPSGQS